MQLEFQCVDGSVLAIRVGGTLVVVLMLMLMLMQLMSMLILLLLYRPL